MLFRAKWTILTVSLLFFCSKVGGFAENADPDTADFVLVKENDGISIYERWLTIKPDQQAREIKATFLLRARPNEAVALIKDESRGRQWNKNTRAYKIISQNDNNWFGYIQYDLPWPVSNQDCVLQYNQNYSGNSLRVEFHEARHPSFPIQKRIQRIPEINGRWIFTETEMGVAVEYYISTTPSTTLPGWLTDPIIRNNLIETLQVFREILEGDDN
jgi:hypothetical protein